MNVPSKCYEFKPTEVLVSKYKNAASEPTIYIIVMLYVYFSCINFGYLWNLSNIYNTYLALSVLMCVQGWCNNARGGVGPN